MNKRKAAKLLASVQNNYVRAIGAFNRANDLSARGKTTQALDERDKAMVYIRKAEWGIVELDGLIEAAP